MFRVHDENEKCLPMVCHGGCFHQPDDSGPQQIPSLISLSERRGRSEANPVGILCIVKAFFFFLNYYAENINLRGKPFVILFFLNNRFGSTITLLLSVLKGRVCFTLTAFHVLIQAHQLNLIN